MALVPEQDFRLLFESAPGLYLALLPDLTIAAVSNAYLEATMTERKKITGHGLFEIFPDNPNDIEADGVMNLRASLNYVAEHKHAHTMAVQKYDIRRPDGTFEVRYWLPVNTPILNEQNELVYIIHNVEDVTAVQKAGDDFRKSEKNFQSLLGSVKEYAIYMLDANGNVSTWNSGAEAIKGYKAEEIIGKPMDVFYTAGEIASDVPRQNLKKALQYGHYETEGYRVKKDGSRFYADVAITPVYENGQLHGYAKITKDITERRKSEDTIRFMATILDNIQDPVIATDNNFFITSWNEGAEKLLEWKARDVLGRSAIEVLKADFPFEKRKEILSQFANNDFWHGEVVYHSKSGAPVNALVTLSKIKGAGGVLKGNLILARDITKRKLTEEKLKKSVDEMEAFTYSISHDLRAPLRSIIGFANILEEDYGDKLDEEAKRITGVIKKNTSRMGRLIDDLLGFSRTGKLELIKTSVDSDKMVKQIIDEVAPNNPEEKIDWIIHPLPPVKADLNTLNQVWINLISNAVKYSGKADKPKIEIGSIKENGNIAFFVKDNGVGFDEKYKHKLFNVFQRLHSNEEFEGTGIGLAIVDKIISRHGGKVLAEGEVDKGATFYFSLPNNN